MAVDIVAAIDGYSSVESYCEGETDQLVTLTPIQIEDEEEYAFYTVVAVEVNGEVVAHLDLADLRDALYTFN